MNDNEWDYEEDEIIDLEDVFDDPVEIEHSEDKIDMIIAPNNIILGESSSITMKEMLRRIGWKPCRISDYKGYLKGKNGKRYFAWLKHRWGEYYNLYVKGLDRRILESPKGPCFIPRFTNFYKVDFEHNDLPALSLLRETEYILQKYGGD